MPELTNPQHEAFCFHVASGLSLSRAARLTGYSIENGHNTGSRLLKREEIRNRVDELRRTHGLGNQADVPGSKPWCVVKFIAIIEGCMGAFYRNRPPKSAATVMPDAPNAIKALEALCKLQGYMPAAQSYSESRVIKLDARTFAKADLDKAINQALLVGNVELTPALPVVEQQPDSTCDK